MILKECSTDRQPVILLGASNLTIGWRHLLRALRESVAGPVDLRVAIGMGRSYVGWSSFWLRRLPGIVDCGLLKTLPSQTSKPPLILITDIGNDVVYGHDPHTILNAVTKCIETLQSWRSDSRIVLTGLPIASLESVQRMQFLIARTLLFPGCSLPYSDIVSRASAIDSGIRQIAATLQIPYVVSEAEWYGHDPIHVRRHLREKVFRQYFSHWAMADETEMHSMAERRGSVPLPASAIRTVCGFIRRTRQPVFEADDIAVSAW